MFAITVPSAAPSLGDARCAPGAAGRVASRVAGVAATSFGASRPEAMRGAPQACGVAWTTFVFLTPWRSA